jgi:hypothetical protein
MDSILGLCHNILISIAERPTFESIGSHQRAFETCQPPSAFIGLKENTPTYLKVYFLYILRNGLI